MGGIKNVLSSLFFDKVAVNFIKKRLQYRSVCSCEFRKIFKNTYLLIYERLLLNLITLDLETTTNEKNLETYEEHMFIWRTMLRYYKYLWLFFHLKRLCMVSCFSRVVFVILRSGLMKVLFWNFFSFFNSQHLRNAKQEYLTCGRVFMLTLSSILMKNGQTYFNRYA